MINFDNDSQHIYSMMYNEPLFSCDKPVDMEVPIPAISLATIESIFTPAVNQQPNRLEDFSSKEDKLLENGQIKILTHAIDSYYNSTINPSSSNSSEMFIPAHTVDGACEAHDEVTPALTYQYASSPVNSGEMTRSTYASKDQRKTWNLNVGKKILSVQFSPMHIRSELLSKQTMLDGFESLTIQEAINAAYKIVIGKPETEDALNNYRADFYADPRPVELVHSCEKSRAFRKLNLNDKIILLKNAFLDLNSLRNITLYNPSINGWFFGRKICSRENLFSRNSSLFKKAVHLMDTFPHRFRGDITVETLLFLIVIFNANLPNLKFKNQIKSEQYIYIYLLRRYLVSTIKPTCEALEYFYQLMATIEDIQTMKRAVEQDFDDYANDGACLLMNRLVRFIEVARMQQ